MLLRFHITITKTTETCPTAVSFSLDTRRMKIQQHVWHHSICVAFQIVALHFFALFVLFCITPRCTALLRVVLLGTALLCGASHCFALSSFESLCFADLCFALLCIVRRCIASLWTVFLCVGLLCLALHGFGLLCLVLMCCVSALT